MLGLKRTVTALTLALTLVACSTSQGDGGPPPKGGPPAGTPGGTLVAAGTGFFHTFDLNSGTEWSERMRYSAPWSTEVVHQPGHELLVATTSGANPVIVQRYDLDTFGLKGADEWPDSTGILSVYSVASTHDGAYLAIIMEAFGEPFLEVIEAATGAIAFTGFEGMLASNIVWGADDRLYVTLDFSYENEPSKWGQIVAFPLANLVAATGGKLEGYALATFTRAEWHHGVSGLALSPDGDQLLFQRSSDLWVLDLEPDAEPHQLTTGPSSNHGGVFSPNGTHIAFASGSSIGLQETYVIPNHRQAPLFIDHGQGVGDEYLLEDNTMVDFMLAWLP